jgi:hypothetical protein
MYNKVAKDLNFPAREKEIAQLWKDKDIVRRSFHFRARRLQTAARISVTSKRASSKT